MFWLIDMVRLIFVFVPVEVVLHCPEAVVMTGPRITIVSMFVRVVVIVGVVMTCRFDWFVVCTVTSLDACDRVMNSVTVVRRATSGRTLQIDFVTPSVVRNVMWLRFSFLFLKWWTRLTILTRNRTVMKIVVTSSSTCRNCWVRQCDRTTLLLLVGALVWVGGYGGDRWLVLVLLWC